MSTNTIPERQDGTTIFASWANDIRTALSGDVVPRNVSGVPTDQAGSIGSTSYKWLEAFFNNLYLYNSTTRTKISRASGGSNHELILPNAAPAQNSAPIHASTAGVISYDLTGNFVESAASGDFDSSATSFTDVTNLSVTITSNGRPVWIGLIGDSASVASRVASTSNGNRLRFLKNGATSLCDMFVGSDAFIHPPGMFNFIDTAATAGSITYKLQVQASSGAQTMSVYRCKLVAVQL